MRERRGSNDHREARPRILGLLIRWGRLCESDIDRMLRLPYVITPTLRSMARDRLIHLEHIGDEDVAVITEHGKAWLQRSQQEQQPDMRVTQEDQIYDRASNIRPEQGSLEQTAAEAAGAKAEDAEARP